MKINPQTLAPVVLFTYNRLIHTKKVISSLNENSLCIFTDLIVFSDGPKEKKHESEVNKIRSYLKTIEFKKMITDASTSPPPPQTSQLQPSI